MLTELFKLAKIVLISGWVFSIFFGFCDAEYKSSFFHFSSSGTFAEIQIKTQWAIEMYGSKNKAIYSKSQSPTRAKIFIPKSKLCFLPKLSIL